jgi:hypothetical protein
MTTYEIQPTSTVYMDGSGIYFVRERGVPGIVASLRLHVGEVERVEELLRVAAYKAWEEGAEAAIEREHTYGAAEKAKYSNPYTAEAQVDGL